MSYFTAHTVPSSDEVKKRDEERLQISPDCTHARLVSREQRTPGPQRRGVDEALPTTFPMSAVAGGTQGRASDD